MQARSRKGCTVDNSGAADPEKAWCSLCPEPCPPLRMISCAGARVWGSHEFVLAGGGVYLFCMRAEFFFFFHVLLYTVQGGGRGVPAKLALFFGFESAPRGSRPQPEGVGRGERRRDRRGVAGAKNALSVEKDRILLCVTRLPCGAWGVPRRVAQGCMW